MFIKDIQISWNLLNVHSPAYLNSELFLRCILYLSTMLCYASRCKSYANEKARPSPCCLGTSGQVPCWKSGLRIGSLFALLLLPNQNCFLPPTTHHFHSFIHSEFETCSALCIQTINWIIRTFHKSNGETILLEQDISDKHALQRERAILVVIIRFWSLRAINVTGSGWKIQSC